MEKETEISQEEEPAVESCCLIGVDDDIASIEAFDFYAGHLYKPGGRAILVHVVKPAVRSSNQLSIHLHAVRETRRVEEKRQINFIQDFYEEKLISSGIPGQINVIYYSKQPGSILCKMAEENNCSMIVVGVAKGEAAVADGLGSEVDYLLRKAHCTVIVVHQKSENELESRLEGLVEERSADGEGLLTARSEIRKTSCPEVSEGLSQAHVKGLAALDIYPNHQTSEIKRTARRHSTAINAFLRSKFSK